jgi:magnesium chelatase family protein
MACTIRSMALAGVDGVPIAVEVDLLRRLPGIAIVGLPDGAVRESADRVRSALEASGLDWPKRRILVNLAPADVRKAGSAFDLPIAIGILVADGQVDLERTENTVFVGELSLHGGLSPVRGALPTAIAATATGATRIVLPAASAAEAAVVEGIEILAADDLAQIVRWLKGDAELRVAEAPPPTAQKHGIDLAEVRGQHRARRAMEVAAAGGHNMLMIGPPGCGKTMLAARMPTILPDMAFNEAVDLTRVHSVAGLVAPGSGLLTRRPFRAPHHSISVAGMVGNAQLLPGEASLAHHGVLFLDEVLEFKRHVLEVLRSPLENRSITISRAKGTVRFPASFSLIAAANPCPCGFSGHPSQPCTCGPYKVEQYRNRLSGPLMDRIDLQVWVQPVDPSALVRSKPGESSEMVRARVERARSIQRERFGQDATKCNAELAGDRIRQAAHATREAEALLQETLHTHGLSARAWARILKVARTIADLDGDERVDCPHILEASSYRIQLDPPCAK